MANPQDDADADLCENPDCRRSLQPHDGRCRDCGHAADPPNVRAARRARERDALTQRFSIALEGADQRLAREVVDGFHQTMRQSFAVWCRRVAEIHRLAKSEHELAVSFYRQVQSLSRVPLDNVWDRYRAPADSTLFPYYYQDMMFAALSLDVRGVRHFGEVAVRLREKDILNRATVFEKNSRIFLEERGVVVGRPVPAGYRAQWGERDRLAVAKLAHRLEASTAPEDFPKILLDDAAGVEADFIEVHIWGEIRRTIFEHLVAKNPAALTDQAFLLSIKHALEPGVRVDILP